MSAAAIPFCSEDYVVHNKFSELPKQDLWQLYNTSLQYNSRMKKLVKYHLGESPPFDVLAVRCFVGDTLVGWGYIELNEKETYLDIGIYVKREYRNKGYAAKILNNIRQIHRNDKAFCSKQLIASPWDVKGKMFFTKHGIRYV